MDAFQTLPVPEPHKLISLDLLICLLLVETERPCDERLDAGLGFIRQLACGFVLLDEELGPHHKMCNVFVNVIRPVIVEDFVVLWVRERRVARRSEVVPVKEFLLDIGRY